MTDYPVRDEVDEPRNWPRGEVPDGWVIVHYRMGSTCYFGPWETHGEMVKWYRAEGQAMGVSPHGTPMWRKVRWDRDV